MKRKLHAIAKQASKYIASLNGEVNRSTQEKQRYVVSHGQFIT